MVELLRGVATIGAAGARHRGAHDLQGPTETINLIHL